MCVYIKEWVKPCYSGLYAFWLALCALALCVLAADLECGRDSRTTKTPPFVRLKRDQKQGRNTGRNGRREAGGSGSGLIPAWIPAFVRFWLLWLLFGFWSMPNKTALKQGAFVLPEVCWSCGGVLYTFSRIWKRPAARVHLLNIQTANQPTTPKCHRKCHRKNSCTPALFSRPRRSQKHQSRCRNLSKTPIYK